MREYEFTYIVQPDVEDARLEEIHTRVDATITGGQGLILLRDDWGKRKLAYEIQKFQKGHYFMLQILGDGKFIPELERILRLDADVLRFLAVLIDENVRDVDARKVRAAKDAEERAERKAERERLEAERSERERASAAEAAERAESAAAAAEAAAATAAAASAAAAAATAEESDDTQPIEPPPSAGAADGAEGEEA